MRSFDDADLIELLLLSSSGSYLLVSMLVRFHGNRFHFTLITSSM